MPLARNYSRLEEPYGNVGRLALDRALTLDEDLQVFDRRYNGGSSIVRSDLGILECQCLSRGGVSYGALHTGKLGEFVTVYIVNLHSGDREWIVNDRADEYPLGEYP